MIDRKDNLVKRNQFNDVNERICLTKRVLVIIISIITILNLFILFYYFEHLLKAVIISVSLIVLLIIANSFYVNHLNKNLNNLKSIMYQKQQL